MVDSKALRIKMLESGCTAVELAAVCSISTTALYRRLQNKVAFRVPEMLAVTRRLSLSNTERDEIFFAQKVS